MNKWKITSLVSLIAILSLSAIVGWQFLQPSNDDTKEQIEPSNDDTNSSTEEPEITEKPKFHIYGVNVETFGYGLNNISYHMQNLGNVDATDIVVTFQIKVAPGSHASWYREGSQIYFAWIRDNMTIDIMRSKEANIYYTDNVWSYIVSGGLSIKGTAGHLHDIVILESHWNITCAEGVTEEFHF